MIFRGPGMPQEMLLFHDAVPANRSIVPVAKDYQHGEFEPLHYHDCAQLIHSLSGVVQVNTRLGSWVVPPGRGVWLPARVEHSLQITGKVAARALLVDPLARADLPASCEVVQISPLLRELIICAMDITADYPAGGREERIMELILDELRVLPILAAEFARAAQRCPIKVVPAYSAITGTPLGVRTGRQLHQCQRPHAVTTFQRETGLRFGDWVRRARLLAALNALAAGHSVLEVALDLGYDSPSAFSAMFRRQLGVAPSTYFAK
jgi:AraC-like DNA-binding protein